MVGRFFQILDSNKWVRLSVLLCMMTFILTKGVQGSCKPLDHPYYGRLDGNCEGNLTGDSCHLRCIEGFKSVGKANKVCLKTGIWSGGKPRCVDRKIRCQPLTPPLNGSFVGRCGNVAGLRCDFRCHSGFLLTGSDHVVCSQGSRQWIPRKPKCKAISCPVLHQPENGAWETTDCIGREGGYCKLLCDPGYHLVGSKVRTCTKEGVWDGKAAACVRSCPSLPTHRNGRFRGSCSPGLAGQVCKMICRKGYVTETREMKCQENGRWSAAMSQCSRKKCPSFLPPTNGSMFGQCSPGLFGESCIFSCESGYKLNGSESAICRYHGRWTQSAPLCQELTCTPISSSYVSEKKGSCDPGIPNHWCKIVNCVAGYRVHGAPNVTCLQNGQWSSKQPVCVRRTECPKLMPPKNGYLGNCSSSFGSTCKQFCNPGFLAKGPSYRVCQPLGYWNGVKLKCIKKSCLDEALKMLSPTNTLRRSRRRKYFHY